MNIQNVISNSYKNYHVKGFDYICLSRSSRVTQKLYFFDGDVSQLPEVVNPHDHRYDFHTLCVAGAVENLNYIKHVDGDHYEVFDFDTPLNGGSGFKWVDEQRLKNYETRRYVAGQTYDLKYHQLHTIRMAEPETVLMLNQFHDKVPLGMPTRTYTKDREPPSLSGLYEKFKPDEIIAKLTRLSERVPSFILPQFE